MSTSIEITLSASEYAQLCDLARERGCTVQDLVREAAKPRLDWVYVAYLDPLREQARPAESPETWAGEAPPTPDLPASLTRLLAGVESGGMFAGLEEIVDNLDALREQWEADLPTTPEDEAP